MGLGEADSVAPVPWSPLQKLAARNVVSFGSVGGDAEELTVHYNIT